MPLPRLLSRARAALGALVLGISVSSCGAAGAPVKATAAPTGCDPAHLDVCERAIVTARAEGRPVRELVAGYAAARASRDEGDGWARLYRGLDAKPGGPGAARVAIVVDPGGPAAAAKAAASAAGIGDRVIEAASLPRPEGIDAAELLLAMGEAAQLDLVVRAGPAGITQLVPADPLAPFFLGMLPVVRADDTFAHLDKDLALAATLREAIDAAGAFRYVDAARAAERLGALVEGREPFSEPVLRARYGYQLLAYSGLVLEGEATADPDAPVPPVPSAPAPAATDTPYGDMLRVRVSKDDRAAWGVRRASILAGVPADRREDLDALFAKTSDCASAGRLPPMAGRRDLPFGPKLSTALATPSPGGGTPPAGMPLADWLKRYEVLVGAVEQTRTAWEYLPTLLYQRGEAQGLSPAGTSTYRRVTALGQQHLGAIKQLEETFPARYQGISILPFAFAPGLIGDDVLREALIHLSQATVQDKLARAADANKVVEGVITGVFAGMSYPPALQAAHYLALQGAFTAKLHGDLLKQSGWAVAGLYAVDAVYRIATDTPGNVGFSTAQVARALDDPKIPLPALAALATSLSRYAALAVQKKLAPAVLTLDRFPADRRAARDSLRAAIAGLGAPGEAPNNVLDDVTELADGLIATLSTAVSEPTKPAPPGTCAARTEASLTPDTRRSLGKLGDVRRRILGHPRYKAGDGAWIRRARLLVTLLSDAMDVALKGKKLEFVIPAAEGEKRIADGLREWDERSAADGLAAAYRLVRGAVAAKGPEDFLAHDGPELRRVLTGLLGYFRGDPTTKGTMGVTLLDALASMPISDKGDDLVDLLIDYSKGFYAKKEQDHGDLWLLASLTVNALSQTMPKKEALELAAANKSRLGWAMRFLSEVSRASRAGTWPDTTAYADDMRRATDDSCASVGVEEMIEVVQALRDFHDGKRKEARAALDRVLERADEKGLAVPRMMYKYEEKTATKVFALTLDISYGTGFLEGANTFQLGFGVRSKGEPESSLTSKLSTDAAKSGEEAARYYVRTAALAACFHFLDGDVEHAVGAARRAVSALVAGVKLGPRAVRADKPGSWGKDARVLLAIDAELAAEAGMPMLAGDLWTVERQALGDAFDDKDVASFFDGVPGKLDTTKELKPILERATKALRVVASPLPCTDAKVELGGYEEGTCETYPLALSLRVADVLKKLPRLRKGTESGPRCEAMRGLDAFLGTMEKGSYDPDLFTKALEELRAAGLGYEAGVLLTRQKRPEHCSPVILTAARALGRSALLGPLMRSDALACAVNCGTGTIDEALIEDLVALDENTRRLPDPTHNLKVMLTVADLAARTDRWDLLARIASAPDFVDRWMTVNPGAAAAALLLQHAAGVLWGEPAMGDRQRSTYELLCETFPPGDRADLCSTIKELRQPGRAEDERKKLAKEAVKKLVTAATTPPKPPAAHP